MLRIKQSRSEDRHETAMILVTLKERERVVGKAAGDECVFIPGE